MTSKTNYELILKTNTMITFKKAKVIMLPTNQKTNIQQNKFNKLFYSEQIKAYSDTINQHLYIISDDEIKEGDYILNIETNNIFKADSIEYLESHNIIEDFDKSFYINSKYAKKIIATTDSSLKIETILSTQERKLKSLPQPSHEVIEKYIEEYNKGNIITDVLVECEGTISSTTWEHDEPEEWRLKINPEYNSIIIKKVKDSWSREEVENLIYTAMKDRCYTTVSEWRKWIEENL